MADWKLIAIWRPTKLQHYIKIVLTCPDDWIHLNGSKEPLPSFKCSPIYNNITADAKEMNNVADK